MTKSFVKLIPAAIIGAIAAAALLQPPPAKAVSGRPAESQHIALIDQYGRTVNLQSFTDKPSLVLFGFTNCPSICPTALAEVGGYLKELGPLAAQMNVIFITADPEHDTPEILRDYLAYFDKRIIGLTGTAANTGRIAKSLGAHIKRVPLEGGGYTIEHTAFGLLMDRNWQRSGLLVIGQAAKPGYAVNRLRKFVTEAVSGGPLR